MTMNPRLLILVVFAVVTSSHALTRAPTRNVTISYSVYNDISGCIAETNPIGVTYLPFGNCIDTFTSNISFGGNATQFARVECYSPTDFTITFWDDMECSNQIIDFLSFDTNSVNCATSANNIFAAWKCPVTTELPSNTPTPTRISTLTPTTTVRPTPTPTVPTTPTPTPTVPPTTSVPTTTIGVCVERNAVFNGWVSTVSEAKAVCPTACEKKNDSMWTGFWRYVEGKTYCGCMLPGCPTTGYCFPRNAPYTTYFSTSSEAQAACPMICAKKGDSQYNGYWGNFNSIGFCGCLPNQCVEDKCFTRNAQYNQTYFSTLSEAKAICPMVCEEQNDSQWTEYWGNAGSFGYCGCRPLSCATTCLFPRNVKHTTYFSTTYEAEAVCPVLCETRKQGATWAKTWSNAGSYGYCGCTLLNCPTSFAPVTPTPSRPTPTPTPTVTPALTSTSSSTATGINITIPPPTLKPLCPPCDIRCGTDDVCLVDRDCKQTCVARADAVNVTSLSFVIQWRSRSSTWPDGETVLDIDTVLRYMSYLARIPQSDFVLHHDNIERLTQDDLTLVGYWQIKVSLKGLKLDPNREIIAFLRILDRSPKIISDATTLAVNDPMARLIYNGQPVTESQEVITTQSCEDGTVIAATNDCSVVVPSAGSEATRDVVVLVVPIVVGILVFALIATLGVVMLHRRRQQAVVKTHIKRETNEPEVSNADVQLV